MRVRAMQPHQYKNRNYEVGQEFDIEDENEAKQLIAGHKVEAAEGGGQQGGQQGQGQGGQRGQGQGGQGQGGQR